MARKLSQQSVDLTSETLSHGIRDLLQVAAGWETHLFSEQTDSANAHHENFLREFLKLVWSHWDSVEVARVDDGVIRAGDERFNHLWKHVASELQNYQDYRKQKGVSAANDQAATINAWFKDGGSEIDTASASKHVTIWRIHRLCQRFDGNTVSERAIEEIWDEFQAAEVAEGKSWIASKRGAVEAAKALIAKLFPIGARRMNTVKKAFAELDSTQESLVTDVPRVMVDGSTRQAAHIPLDIMDSYALGLLGCTPETAEVVLADLNEQSEDRIQAYIRSKSMTPRWVHADPQTLAPVCNCEEVTGTHYHIKTAEQSDPLMEIARAMLPRKLKFRF